MEEPAERLVCGRVELRRWLTTDLDVLDRAINESLEHLAPWMPWAAGHGRTQTEGFLARNREEWATGEAYGYAITSGGTVIGSCGLHRRIGEGGLEIGYWIHPRRTGQGLATMAAGALVHQGFRLPGTDRVEIHHDAANTASGAVPRRLGFTEITRVAVPGGPATSGATGIDVIWRLTAADWRAPHEAPATGALSGGVGHPAGAQKPRAGRVAIRPGRA